MMNRHRVTARTPAGCQIACTPRARLAIAPVSAPDPNVGISPP
jgi:hypothetical protein